MCKKNTWILSVSFFILLSSFLNAEVSPKVSLVDSSRFFEIVDFDGKAFAYAPAIIQENGVYKTVFCSSGASSTSWDFLRYTDSDSWGESKPIPVVLKPTSKQVGDGKNRSTCDPSIIKTKGWYYVYFTGSSEVGQASVYISRTRDLSDHGSYEFYIGSSLVTGDQWRSADSGADPLAVVRSSKNIPNQRAKQEGWYGAGQQSVIKRGDVWYMWYYDETDSYSESGKSTSIEHSIYLRTSRDGIHWGQRLPSFSCANSSIVTRCISSVEVRYNPVSNQFVMFYIHKHHEQMSSLRTRTSQDGRVWSQEQILCGESCFPNYAHNVGVSADLNGYLSTTTYSLLAFGVPYSSLGEASDNFQRPAWDLFGVYLKISSSDGSLQLVRK